MNQINKEIMKQLIQFYQHVVENPDGKQVVSKARKIHNSFLGVHPILSPKVSMRLNQIYSFCGYNEETHTPQITYLEIKNLLSDLRKELEELENEIL